MAGRTIELVMAVAPPPMNPLTSPYSQVLNLCPTFPPWFNSIQHPQNHLQGGDCPCQFVFGWNVAFHCAVTAKLLGGGATLDAVKIGIVACSTPGIPLSPPAVILVTV